ncbi:MAG: hypothetical protein AAFO58_09555, partial [Pseudomonadota bacterium]
MRILSIITAILVVAFLFVLVFERDLLTGGAGDDAAAMQDDGTETTAAAEAETGADMAEDTTG